ncbi:Periplasmic serine endoprotease DegP precursor [Planctomycetes bacterium Pan216]|uniref:Periplasmic serine endoprotease DegP n=1 Tax=Kolteria novifilia TaxID=2527975 RepID=A0A518B296_9BACT|nr:Periplasmic serine endoprotease DegP precursor [Planctomycetes bacterium Pan216]
MTMTRTLPAIVLLLAAIPLTAQGQSPETSATREAVARAVQHVAPSVVRIETTTGMERIGRVRKGLGPSTGTIVGADGWIVSSSFNLAHRPAGIIVSLADGRKFPARVVAQDDTRKLTLLNVDASGLPVPTPAPKDAIASGAWAIALGKVWSNTEPSISVGIVSAVDRLDGRAIQTDAKISPTNYGGPLVDIEGRVLGVLVPLSPGGDSVEAGLEWYDSGIGFAISFEEILSRLDRFQKDELKRGYLGVAFGGKNRLAELGPISRVAWHSPIASLGVQRGDRILAINGKTIERYGHLVQALRPLYANDVVTLTVERDGKRQTHEVPLAAKLPVYERPYAGVLVDHAKTGVRVRGVVPGSPAEAAGLRAGDVIGEVKTSDSEEPSSNSQAKKPSGKPPSNSPLDKGEQKDGPLDKGEQKDGPLDKGENRKDKGEPNDVVTLAKVFDDVQPGGKVELTVDREGKTLAVPLTLGRFPLALPEEVPSTPLAPGEWELKSSEAERDAAWSYAPKTAVKEPLGVLFTFRASDDPTAKELAERWKPVLEKHRLLLAGIGPKAKRWQRSDLERASTLLEDLEKRFPINRDRVIVVGRTNSGAVAEAFVNANRRRVGGLVLLDGGRLSSPETHPDEKLAYWIGWSTDNPKKSGFEQAAQRLRKAKHPVLGGERTTTAKTYPPADERQRIGRWSELIGAL